jgi:hypothetical protein
MYNCWCPTPLIPCINVIGITRNGIKIFCYHFCKIILSGLCCRMSSFLFLYSLNCYPGTLGGWCPTVSCKVFGMPSHETKSTFFCGGGVIIHFQAVICLSCCKRRKLQVLLSQAVLVLWCGHCHMRTVLCVFVDWKWFVGLFVSVVRLPLFPLSVAWALQVIYLLPKVMSCLFKLGQLY